MAYMYYTIWTIRDRSWGGIRVETRKKELDNIEQEQQQYVKSLEPRWSYLTV